MGRKYWLLIFFCTVLGCHTAPFSPPPVPESDWKTLAGQLRYRHDDKSIIGDVIIRWSPSAQAVTMEFSKGGVALIKVTRTLERAWASGPLAGSAYHGLFFNVPARLQGWFYAPVHEINIRAKSQTCLFEFGANLYEKPYPDGRDSFDFQFNP